MIVMVGKRLAAAAILAAAMAATAALWSAAAALSGHAGAPRDALWRTAQQQGWDGTAQHTGRHTCPECGAMLQPVG